MPKFKIRMMWLMVKDTEFVLEIDRRSYPEPWTEERFVRVMKRRDSIGMIAKDDHELICGFMIYKLMRSAILVRRFAVHPDYRELSVGTQMLKRLMEKLSSNRRTRLNCSVDEYHVQSQLWLRKRGFRAIGIDQGLIQMQHRLKDVSTEPSLLDSYSEKDGDL
jgi:ribosomal-protein-alanine N-acetyltransferase